MTAPTLTLFLSRDEEDPASVAAREVMQVVLLQLDPCVEFKVRPSTAGNDLAPILVVSHPAESPLLIKAQLASPDQLLAVLERAGVPIVRT